MTEERDVGVTPIIEACDPIIDRIEDYLQQLHAEHPRASASGDSRYLYRVTRGIEWSEELLDMMDDVLERVGLMRHNHNQLRWSRDGKLV